MAFPLTVLGTVWGRNWNGKADFPCKISKTPRPIPPLPWLCFTFTLLAFFWLLFAECLLQVPSILGSYHCRGRAPFRQYFHWNVFHFFLLLALQILLRLWSAIVSVAFSLFSHRWTGFLFLVFVILICVTICVSIGNIELRRIAILFRIFILLTNSFDLFPLKRWGPSMEVDILSFLLFNRRLCIPLRHLLFPHESTALHENWENSHAKPSL